jgi:hypothetical protein
MLQSDQISKKIKPNVAGIKVLPFWCNLKEGDFCCKTPALKYYSIFPPVFYRCYGVRIKKTPSSFPFILPIGYGCSSSAQA